MSGGRPIGNPFETHFLMMASMSTIRPRGLPTGFVAFGLLAGALALSGCGGEPTGDAAYSQQFEKPAAAPAAPGGAAQAPGENPYSLRNREKDE